MNVDDFNKTLEKYILAFANKEEYFMALGDFVSPGKILNEQEAIYYRTACYGFAMFLSKNRLESIKKS